MTFDGLSDREARRLHDELSAAVPAAPLVVDRASRAIGLARRRRYRATAAMVGAGTALAVSAAVGVPLLTTTAGDVAVMMPAEGDETVVPSPAPPSQEPVDVVLNTSDWTPRSGYGMEAIVGATLSIDAEGCVHLTYGDSGRKSDVVWPKGFTARLGDDGKVILFDSHGKIALREGQTFQTAGGTIQYSGLQCRSATGEVEVVNGVVRPTEETEQAAASALADCDRVGDGPLGLDLRDVIRAEQISGADYLTWVGARAQTEPPPGRLSGLRPDELLTLCVLSVAGLAPPGPPPPDGWRGQRVPVDTAVVVVRADGSMTVDGTGPRSVVLAELASLLSAS